MLNNPISADSAVADRGSISVRTNLPRAVLFTLATALLFTFSYANAFTLPIGGCAVSSVIDDANRLYGVELDVIGAIDNSSSTSFDLIDLDTGDRIYVVWLGAGDLPFDGSKVEAHGQLVSSTLGPAILADEVRLLSAHEQILDGAWALSVIRWFAILVTAFIIMVLLSSTLVLYAHLSRRSAISMLANASGEISSILGIVVISLFCLLALSERMEFAISSLFLVLSPLLMIVSMIMREIKEHWISLFTDAMPLIVVSTIVVWLLLSVIQGDMSVFDSASALIWRSITDSTDSMVSGVIGFLSLSIFVIYLKSDVAEIEDKVRLLSREVE